MIELLPFSNLMPALFQGEPNEFSPDFSSEEFKALLFNQMVQMEGEVWKESRGQRLVQVPLAEELFLPPSDENKSYFYDSIRNLQEKSPISPVSIPDLFEGQGLPVSPQPLIEIPLIVSTPESFLDAVGNDIPCEPLLFSEKTVEGRDAPSFIAKSLSEDASERLSFETKSKGVSFNPSLLEREKDVMEKTHQLFQGESGDHKGSPSVFHAKGKETEHFPETWKTEGDRQKVLTSSHSTFSPSGKDGAELIGKLESNGDPHLNRSNSEGENDSHRSIPPKEKASLSESFLIQSKIGTESKSETVISGESQKAQRVFSAETESFELYHQVGRKMAWSIQNGEERVRLTLDPPRLGNLYMEVIKEREMVKATLWAENHVTKELLEAHRMELRRILEEDGFKLERFDVFVRQETDRFMDRKGFAFFEGQQEPWGSQNIRADLPSEFPEASFLEERPFFGQSHFIDRII